jgi:phospholipid N-methyltransferase
MWDTLPEQMSVTPSEAARIASACPEDGVVLELGCNIGRGTERILRALGGKGTVIAIDNDPELTRQARSRCPQATVVTADSRTYRPDQVDVVLVDDQISGRVARASQFKSAYPNAVVFVHDYHGTTDGMVRV